VLPDNSPARQAPILLLLLRGQRVTARFLLGRLAIGVQFLYALIAFVAYALYRGVYDEVTALEELEIVLTSLADSDTDDLAGLLRDDEL
jgi:hypothetical protein